MEGVLKLLQRSFPCQQGPLLLHNHEATISRSPISCPHSLGGWLQPRRAPLRSLLLPISLSHTHVSLPSPVSDCNQGNEQGGREGETQPWAPGERLCWRLSSRLSFTCPARRVIGSRSSSAASPPALPHRGQGCGEQEVPPVLALPWGRGRCWR